MLNKKFASKCVKDQFDLRKEDKTLKDFLSTYLECSNDVDDIRECLLDKDNYTLVNNWAKNNKLDFDSFVNRLIELSDAVIIHHINADLNYDNEFVTINDVPYQEVRFTGDVTVASAYISDTIVLDLDEWFESYEIN